MTTVLSASTFLQPLNVLHTIIQFAPSDYLLLVFLLCAVIGFLKGIYNRYFHPLRNFPGPFWGGFTDFYKLYIFASKHIPSATMELHQKYGISANNELCIKRVLMSLA